MNLHALFINARLAEHAGVDWWNHASSDGRSLRAALNFLAPYADRRNLVKKDLNSRPRGNHPLLVEARRHWEDPKLDELLAKFGTAANEPAARWRLTLNAP